MLSLPDMKESFRRLGRVSVLGVLLLPGTQALAQSGRRAPKPQAPTATPSPTTVETNDASVTKPGQKELSHKVTIIVAKQPTSKHLPSEDGIYASFMKRLSEFTNVTVNSAGDLKRSEAILRAKSEKETMVVLLQFDIDSFQNGTIILNSPDLDVRVLTFEPGTGKEAFKGKVYYKAVGGPMMKKDNWPNGPPIKITTEAVGVEGAEQLHDWLLIEELRQKS
jgi:hypothetical protein